MHNLLTVVMGTRGIRARRGLALGALFSVAGAGCEGGAGSPTAIDLTVEVDQALVIDTVDIALRAAGKPDTHLTRSPERKVLVRITTQGLATGALVNLEVGGVKGGSTIVLARAQAAVIAARIVPVTVRLTAACQAVLACKTTETCSEGACVAIPSAGDAGMPGSGGAGGTGGAGGNPSASGGNGTGGMDATGGTAGGSATGGGPATGGNGSAGNATGGSGSGGRGGMGSGGAGATGTGGRATGGANTGGIGTGGRATGGAATGGMGTGGAATGGMGTGGAPCATPKMMCGAACVDPQTDATNCATCGHSCLGGTCAGGICQPVLLASPTAGAPTKTTVSNGTVYVEYEFNGRVPGVHSMNATAPSNPATLTGIPGQTSFYTCIMGGKLYWTGLAEQAMTIQSCTLGNCGATTAMITPFSNTMGVGPVCDTSTNELVWITYVTTTVTTYTIYRSSPTGANVRPITTFTFDNDGGVWEFAYSDGRFSNGRADRVFFQRSDGIPPSMSTLYMISTVTPNTSRISLAAYPGATAGNSSLPVIANTNALIIGTRDSAGAGSVFRVPLPNGIATGSAPTWFSGEVVGVADENYFYGIMRASSSVPPDAMIRCPMATPCTSPTILFRGHERAGAFTQDATALYWTLPNFAGGQGYGLWKVAK